MVRIINFDSEKEWIEASINFITKLNPQSIALSGGNTPKPIYQALAKTPLAQSAQFFQVDERHIPADHPDSNQRMIHQTLAPKKFHSFDTDKAIEIALKSYQEKLPKQLDLCILGIGPDGHIASLFPNSPALKSSEKVAHTQTTQFVIKDRLTLTLQTITQSKNTLILLKDKAQVIKKLQDQNIKAKDFPAKYLEDFTLFFCN